LRWFTIVSVEMSRGGARHNLKASAWAAPLAIIFALQATANPAPAYAGSESLVAAAAAWDGLADELAAMAHGHDDSTILFALGEEIIEADLLALS
jgi:PPE-repeat protein